MNGFFWRRKQFPGEQKRGITIVSGPPLGVALHGGGFVSYDALYRESPAVRAVVDFLATNLGQVPLAVYQRVGGDVERKRLGPRDPLAAILREPNARTSGYELRRDAAADLALHGNAYWLMVRDADGAVGSLLRMPPGRVSVVRERESEPSAYRVYFGASHTDFPAEDVCHFRAYSHDGIAGTSPLESLRAVLSEDDAAVKHREGFWRNSARQGGLLERPVDAPDWGKEERDRFKEGWQSAYADAENAGKTPILEDGMKFNPAAFSPRESEYVEARRLTLAFVASVYNVPIQLLGGTDRNVDAAQRGLLTNTLAPWLSWIEETANRSLVPAVHGEQAVYGRIFCEHVLEEKSRGSFRQQAEILEKAVGGPWLSPNEARALINLPRIEGGDTLMYPVSLFPAQPGGGE